MSQSTDVGQTPPPASAGQTPAPADTIARPVNWGPLTAVVGTIVMFILAQLLGGFLLGAGLALLGGYSLSDNQELERALATTEVQFYGNLLVSLSLLVLLRLFLKLRKRGFRSLGLGGWRWRMIGQAAAAYGYYFLSFLVISLILNATYPELLEQEQDIGFNRAASGLSLVPIFISLVVAPPIVEELLVRGFLFGGLRNRLSLVPAALITSLIFAAAHLQFDGSGPVVWAAAIDTFVLSLVLCRLRDKSGSLWPPMLVHAAKNGLAFVAIFVSPAVL